MSDWKRTSREPLAKTRRMTDGELIHLLVGQKPMAVDERDERIYK